MKYRMLSLFSLVTLGACNADKAAAPDPGTVVPRTMMTNVVEVIGLPLRPEAVALGDGTTFFAGSSAASSDTSNHGMIVRGDLTTGLTTTLVAGVRGKATSGLAFDKRSGLLWAAETRGGTGRVYNAATGATVMAYTFPAVAAPGHQINDVTVGPNAAYFSDSFQPVFYRIALSANGTPASDYTVVPLSGDYVHSATAKPFNLNSNGILATSDGKYVLIGNMGGNKGIASANCIVSPRAPADSGCVSDILRVDPATGVATRINFGGSKVYFVDGMRLDGNALYLAQNFMDKVGVFTLSADYLTATFVKDITSSNFAVPSSLLVFENSIFTVNAGFGPGPYYMWRMPK